MLKYDAKLLGFKYTNITGGHFNIGSRKLRGFKKKYFRLINLKSCSMAVAG